MFTEEALNAIFERMDTRAGAFVPFKNPRTGDEGLAYFRDGAATAFIQPSHARYPSVTVRSTQSLLDYMTVYAAAAVEEQSTLLAANIKGLTLSIDYSEDGGAGEREHVVNFPAIFDDECAVAAGALMAALGKWTDLDGFDALLDKTAPFVTNFTTLETAAMNLEGSENVKITRTRSSNQIAYTGNVSGTAELPMTMDVGLWFMGNLITVAIPLRVKIANQKIQFHLVDNGSFVKQQADVMRKIKAEVKAKFPALLMIDGTIGN